MLEVSLEDTQGLETDPVEVDEIDIQFVPLDGADRLLFGRGVVLLDETPLPDQRGEGNITESVVEEVIARRHLAIPEGLNELEDPASMTTSRPSITQLVPGTARRTHIERAISRLAGLQPDNMQKDGLPDQVLSGQLNELNVIKEEADPDAGLTLAASQPIMVEAQEAQSTMPETQIEEIPPQVVEVGMPLIQERVNIPAGGEGLPWGKPEIIFDKGKGEFHPSRLYGLLNQGALETAPEISGIKGRIQAQVGKRLRDAGRRAIDAKRIFPAYKPEIDLHLRQELEAAVTEGRIEESRVKGIFEDAFRILVAGENEDRIQNMIPDLTMLRLVGDKNTGHALVANYDVEIQTSPVALPSHMKEVHYPEVKIPPLPTPAELAQIARSVKYDPMMVVPLEGASKTMKGLADQITDTSIVVQRLVLHAHEGKPDEEGAWEEGLEYVKEGIEMARSGILPRWAKDALDELLVHDWMRYADAAQKARADRDLTWKNWDEIEGVVLKNNERRKSEYERRLAAKRAAQREVARRRAEARRQARLEEEGWAAYGAAMSAAYDAYHDAHGHYPSGESEAAGYM